MPKRKAQTESSALSGNGEFEKSTHMKRKRLDIIKSTNRIPFCDFVTQHVPAKNLQHITKSTHGHVNIFDLEAKTVPYSTMPTSETRQVMTTRELDACFEIVHSTSYEAYSHSSIGWHPRRKKREMREAEMHYLLVHARQNTSSVPARSPEAEPTNGPRAPSASPSAATKSNGDVPQTTNVRQNGPSPTADDKATQSLSSRGSKLWSHLSLTSTPGDELSAETSQRQELHESQSFSAADDGDRLSATTNRLDDAGPGSGSKQHVGPTTVKSVGSATIQTTPEIIGFASFMLTHAPPEPVIYLYELHLLPPYRTLGLGAHLLKTVESIGHSVGVQRAMLTVFKCNVEARQWYAKQGWSVDSTSPADVELRGGKRECDYEIWSKVL